MASVLENRQVRQKEVALGEDQSRNVDFEVAGPGVHLEEETWWEQRLSQHGLLPR